MAFSKIQNPKGRNYPMALMKTSSSLAVRKSPGSHFLGKILVSRVRRTSPGNILFLIVNLAALALFYDPVRTILTFSFHNELYSHIILIPLISGYLIFIRRGEIFSAKDYAFAGGAGVLLSGILIYAVGNHYAARFQQQDYLSLMALALVTFFIGGFTLSYGIRALRVAMFPLTFLVFLIPLPTLLLEKIVFFLQSGSAEVTEGLFRMIHLPLYREGFFFYLPGVTIEIAKECSGIRSSMALVILTVLLSHFFLGSFWRKVLLNVSVVPIILFKNGMRILALTLLAIYVDPSFLTNSMLHRQGGVLFFALGLAILAPILWLLIRSEKTAQSKPQVISEAKPKPGGE